MAQGTYQHDDMTDPDPGPDSPPRPGRVYDRSVEKSDRTYATLMHLTLILAHVGLPVLPPLIMWLIKKDDSPFIDDHGKEAVNFQISLLIYALIGLITVWLCGLGFLVWVATYVLAIVGMIIASVAANRGQYVRYPACLRLI